MTVRVDEIGRKFCRRHGRATCRRCGTNFSQHNRMAQERASTRVLTIDDVAESFSSLMQVMLLLVTVHPPPLEDLESVNALLDETAHVLQILHAEGAPVEGALRQALSWMKPASLEKLLSDMGICRAFKWHPRTILSGISNVIQELKVPENWQKWYLAVRLLCWLYVLWMLICAWDPTFHNAWCNASLSSSVRFALYVSGLELIYALQGRSQDIKWYEVLLPLLRLGVECFVAPMVGCVHRSHIVTVIGWTLGGITADTIFLPLSVFGEMWMLCQAAMFHSFALFIVVALWPLTLVPWFLHVLEIANDIPNVQERRW